MSKKNEILHAAMQLFAVKGYEKSSMAEVAAMTGTTGSNIFYHYRTKEDILLAILRKVKDELLDAFKAEIRVPGISRPEWGMLEGLAAAYLNLSSTHRDWFMLLHHRFPYEMAAVNPTCREHLEAILRLHHRSVRTGDPTGVKPTVRS